jgi:hypothetical protein
MRVEGIRLDFVVKAVSRFHEELPLNDAARTRHKRFKDDMLATLQKEILAIDRKFPMVWIIAKVRADDRWLRGGAWAAQGRADAGDQLIRFEWFR